MEAIGRSLKYIIVVASLVVMALLVIGFNNRMAEQRQLVAQSQKIRTELEALRQTDAYLDAQLAYANSDAAVEEWAYEEAHWVRPGDKPVVPISDAESTPIALPAATPEPIEFANWQVWWALFFDVSAP